jgi:hypothetical protein
MLLLMLISSDCRFSRCRLQFDRKLQSTSHQLARARYKQLLRQGFHLSTCPNLPGHVSASAAGLRRGRSSPRETALDR